MTYYLAYGGTVSISANETTVWYRGKAHVLQDDNTFINLTRGVFSAPARQETLPDTGS